MVCVADLKMHPGISLSAACIVSGIGVFWTALGSVVLCMVGYSFLSFVFTSLT